MSGDPAAFLAARLDEAKAEALARRGIYPSPVVSDGGFVALHVKRGGNAVIVRYTAPVAGYGDMAALKAWADAEHGWTQARALREVEAKRAIAAEHVLAHNQRGYALCFTCTDGPWPCRTVRFLLAVYGDHPDYNPEWKP